MMVARYAKGHLRSKMASLNAIAWNWFGIAYELLSPFLHGSGGTTRRLVSQRATEDNEMRCPICEGAGFIPELCPECDGNPDEMSGTGCPACEGEGYVETPCERCNGTGEAG